MSGLATIAPKVSKLLPMLASDKDGEVLSAVAALRRTLSSAGFDLHDLANALCGRQAEPEPEAHLSQADVIRVLLACDVLSAWERKYVNDLARILYASRPLSAAQWAKLVEIYGQRIVGT